MENTNTMLYKCIKATRFKYIKIRVSGLIISLSEQGRTLTDFNNFHAKLLNENPVYVEI